MNKEHFEAQKETPKDIDTRTPEEVYEEVKRSLSATPRGTLNINDLVIATDYIYKDIMGLEFSPCRQISSSNPAFEGYNSKLGVLRIGVTFVFSVVPNNGGFRSGSFHSSYITSLAIENGALTITTRNSIYTFNVSGEDMTFALDGETLGVLEKILDVADAMYGFY